MEKVNYEEVLFKIAKRLLKRGEPITETKVFIKACKLLNIEYHPGSGEAVTPERLKVLDAWHNLFKKGLISPGYDISRPCTPFFHIKEK